VDTNLIPRRWLRLASGSLAAILVASVASNSQAQASQTDARWQPWLGCWAPAREPVSGDQASIRRLNFSEREASPAQVCIAPATGSGVEFLTVNSGKVVARQRVGDAAERQAFTKEDCSGWQSGRWSDDGKRFYLSSEFTCGAGLKRVSNGLLAISATGEWLDIQSATAGGGSQIQMTRYQDAGVPDGLPADIAASLGARNFAASASRLSAGAPVDARAIVETSRSVDEAVVQAWLMERGQKFDMDAKRVTELANAGVPGSVTDVMIALSYPEVFALEPGADPAEAAESGSRRACGSRVGMSLNPFAYSPYGWGYYSPYGYSNSIYSPYYSSPYSSYYSPYGYRIGYGNLYGNRAPFVVIGRSSSTDSHGQVVNGGGYRQTRPSSGSSGTPRGSVSGGSARPSSGSGQTGSGRTAKGRK
jgi:hypothetical protein